MEGRGGGEAQGVADPPKMDPNPFFVEINTSSLPRKTVAQNV
jgi:hypothetical protein